MKLQDKVVAITGGTQGIGRGIAAAALAEGATVSLNGRSKEKGDKALADFGVGERAAFFAGDVTSQADVEDFIEQTVATFGRIDVLVNNAGGARDLQPTAQLSDEEWTLVMNWNLNSNFWATRRALQHMLPRKYGRIINISSVEGKHGKPVFTAYVAAKHAINGMTKSIAREVGIEGITVNSICPGLVITDIIKNNGPDTAKAMGLTFDEMVAMFAEESSIKRPNTVEEVAAMAMLLASDAGAGITGAILSVDGGTASY
ncbi:SDR family oxidoreductase [Rhodococcus sp. BP-252]|uniref:SDR family NAD(P)-dependent oxidoreductase n=1 Tax=unclassified Rhodococcus (in: high G+C Gram-positive bacteria) TaxID=192944 RepID=UPI001C9BA04F|nr:MULTISPECIES: SDR family NAD(P)-dependent oxidoreductase [unclassified Rhodococcus (in: high G+C Gram-positive bacteria)]MBY6411591.1 SDR family oxidoreductase [Rhodococcus sp. BP-320]MBY6417973.1 SDR family oxidoreductase [Rhodococcus sp. BP-321]MBY6422126.1 SDR family oxidoreductase [Rhodococcus sp. BP-324]MBY6427771.1 SDR family oxidoreductase [Rhodococcus sp. BP-323]MBY6433010.1 SDR family oxidoreductase [Rhodococcus sp. BP-322]